MEGEVLWCLNMFPGADGKAPMRFLGLVALVSAVAGIVASVTRLIPGSDGAVQDIHTLATIAQFWTLFVTYVTGYLYSDTDKSRHPRVFILVTNLLMIALNLISLGMTLALVAFIESRPPDVSALVFISISVAINVLTGLLGHLYAFNERSRIE